jgi:hypothetical protein
LNQEQHNRQGLYDPSHEHDACGVGFVANIKGEASHDIVKKGVKLRDETPRIGHGGSRIAFLDPASTGNVLIELAQLPAGH